MSLFVVSTGFGKKRRPRRGKFWINTSLRRHSSKSQSNIDNMLEKARKVFEIGSFSDDSSSPQDVVKGDSSKG